MLLNVLVELEHLREVCLQGSVLTSLCAARFSTAVCAEACVVCEDEDWTFERFGEGWPASLAPFAALFEEEVEDPDACRGMMGRPWLFCRLGDASRP